MGMGYMCSVRRMSVCSISARPQEKWNQPTGVTDCIQQALSAFAMDAFVRTVCAGTERHGTLDPWFFDNNDAVGWMLKSLTNMNLLGCHFLDICECMSRLLPMVPLFKLPGRDGKFHRRSQCGMPSSPKTISSPC